MSIAMLAQEGPPVRLCDLEAMTGLSRSTIRGDIRHGELTAIKRRGRNAHLMIPRPEARRWLAQLGFSVPCSAPSA